MRNTVIGTAHFGPVYKRKIDVYKVVDGKLEYMYSTNAYRTCRDAVAKAEKLSNGAKFKAMFSVKG